MAHLVDRVLDVVELLAARPAGLALTEICQRRNLPKVTAHRVLSVLGQRGFVEQDAFTDHYRPNASVEDYRLLQKRIGTARVVVVTPSSYGTDNRCMVEAVAKFGPTARGIAVVDTTQRRSSLRLRAYDLNRNRHFSTIQILRRGLAPCRLTITIRRRFQPPRNCW